MGLIGEVFHDFKPEFRIIHGPGEEPGVGEKVTREALVLFGLVGLSPRLPKPSFFPEKPAGVRINIKAPTNPFEHFGVVDVNGTNADTEPTGAKEIAVSWVPPSLMKAAGGETIYTVKRGDTLFQIAGKFRVPRADIPSWVGWVTQHNHLSNPNSITAGQELILPRELIRFNEMPAVPTATVKVTLPNGSTEEAPVFNSWDEFNQWVDAVNEWAASVGKRATTTRLTNVAVGGASAATCLGIFTFDSPEIGAATTAVGPMAPEALILLALVCVMLPASGAAATSNIITGEPPTPAQIWHSFWHSLFKKIGIER